ncbi:MAG TPA: hypothetical protein VJ997_00965, partial [Longimicrobiales bacterium]|nr:hypothetical protein [Longimicrobiales bacterium]
GPARAEVGPAWVVGEDLAGKHGWGKRGAILGAVLVGGIVAQDMIRKPEQCRGSGHYGRRCAVILGASVAAGAGVGGLIGWLASRDSERPRGSSTGAGHTTLSASVGISSYDLSGVGQRAVASARAERLVLARTTVQVGVGFIRYENQSGEPEAMLLPEAGILVAPFEALPWFVGLGAGRTVVVTGGRNDDVTLFGATGLDVRVGGGWSIRPEVRVRTVDPWVGTLADFAVGVAWRIGG